MTEHSPLVTLNGGISQLPDGDTINGVPAQSVTLSATFDGTVTLGMSVYLDSDGVFKAAKSDSANTCDSFGIATLVTGNTGEVTPHGHIVTLDEATWDAVTGGSGGLVAGTLYYLSSTVAGNLTDTQPT